MPNLLNITSPVAPKNYDFTNKNSPLPQTDQVFTLGDTSKVVKTHERNEEFTNQDLKNGNGAFNVNTSSNRDPSVATSILKGIINQETISALRAEGNIDILNKVTEFANEVMLSPSNLSSDMVMQEKEATIYSDPLFGQMKSILVNTSSADMGEAVINFTKVASDCMSRDDILGSISSSLEYLSSEIAPTKNISDLLNELSQNLNKDTFDQLKPTIQSVVSDLQKSLLINDSSKNLLSLIVYNLSRYNGDSSALGDSFNAILDLMPSKDEVLILKQMFINYIEDSALPTDVKLSALESMALGSEVRSSSLSLLAEKIGIAINQSIENIPQGNLARVLSLIDSDGGTSALSKIFTAMLPQNLHSGMSSILKSFDSTGNSDSLVERLGIIINSVDSMDAKVAIADKVNDILAKITVPVTSLSGAIDSILQHQSLTMLAEKLGGNLNAAINKMSEYNLSATLSQLNLASGASSIRAVFEQILPQNSLSELNLLLRSFNTTGDLNKLIDGLSLALNKVDNINKKIILAQAVNQILEKLTESQNVNYKPPTSMSNLMEFLSKNINDPSLKSLSSMSRDDILQGFLSSPGVFTPLLHYLVPINDRGFKAFGELWVDPDAERAVNESDAKHIFLCFELEDYGFFEMELRTSGNNLDMLLLCPKGTEQKFSPIKDAVPKIARNCGYNAENTRVETLVKRRDLSQVFPKIQERRSGLNVKI